MKPYAFTRLGLSRCERGEEDGLGQEIKNSHFDEAHRAEFHRRLRKETATLKTWFDGESFDHDDHFTSGLELEGWLIDENHMPSPRNEYFLRQANDADIVAELSKFNFEINAPARPLQAGVLSQTRRDLEETWLKCLKAGKALDVRPCAIGILPTVRDDMLQPEWMSDSNRYRVMNREVLLRRKQQPLHISISGEETLDYRCDHLMLEAACTSLQSHLKINQDDAVRYYNAAVLAAGPLVAATANSPFLYGKSLWEETRIPAFEQATALHGFRDKSGRNVGRVTLGTGYLHDSLMELFLENLSYSELLPALEDSSESLPHLRLQNGTVWRWVRPIVGFNGQNNPHLRLEHRVMPAGPSLADTVANLALCHGLVLSLGDGETPPEHVADFEQARENFYSCARNGLRANVHWNGKAVNVQTLLVEQLLPAAQRALARQGLDKDDLFNYFHEILEPRLCSGLTGAEWQRSFVDCNGKNFQAMTERYVEHQATGAPVHSWVV